MLVIGIRTRMATIATKREALGKLNMRKLFLNGILGNSDWNCDLKC